MSRTRDIDVILYAMHRCLGNYTIAYTATPHDDIELETKIRLLRDLIGEIVAVDQGEE
jgi:hypothetical protein